MDEASSFRSEEISFKLRFKGHEECELRRRLSDAEDVGEGGVRSGESRKRENALEREG